MADPGITLKCLRCVGSLVLVLRCMDCKQETPLASVVPFGKQHKCNKCHSAYRFCSQNIDDWKNKTAATCLWCLVAFGLVSGVPSEEEKRALILANRDAGGRGKKRELKTVETAPRNTF